MGGGESINHQELHSGDRELAQRLALGDELAAESFHRLLAPRLRATATVLLGYGDPDIEDVVQMAFIAALENIHTYDHRRASLYTWLNRICVYLCFKRCRSRRRMVVHLCEDIQALMPHAAETNLNAEITRWREYFGANLERLGQPCRELLRRRVLDEISYAELSKELRVPMGTVASRVARCLKRLRESIGGNDDIGAR
jgi:RNA polymerase sigma-70 factor (ECF subfamily)